jgi:hypothetical protein
MDSITVLQAMQSLDLMLEDIDDKGIKNWVDNEINGYQKDDDIPNYRKANTMLIGNIQVGYAIHNHINIPLSDSKAIEAFTKLEIRDPISTIIQMSKAESESETNSLMLEANIALVNHYQQTNGDVISAHRKLSIYAYTNILGMIKNKLLEIFKVLEKNYGNLDELYIDFSDSSKKDEIVKELVAIVYNDNSIKIGNNNQFKDSVVGDENGN